MSDKSFDPQGRWRNKTIAFRMSDAENKLLNQYVRMSGLSKQDYLIRKALDTTVEVKGSAKVYYALKDTAEEILEELKKKETTEENLPELLKTITFLSTILKEFKNIEE